MSPSIPAVITLLGAVTSLGLAVVTLSRTPRRRAHWVFAAGMALFAVDGLARFTLLSVTESPAERLLWLRAVLVIGLVLPLPWGLFLQTVFAGDDAARRQRWAWTAGTTLPVLALLVGGVLVWTPFQVADVMAPFYAARLDAIGRYAVMAQLVGVAAVLAGLEAALRSSRGTERWRIKYLTLGLGGVFLVRFYVLSHTLLFEVVMAAHLTAEAATVILGNAAIGISLARNRGLGGRLTVSRQIFYRSVIVAVLGAYLLVVGGLGLALQRVGIPEQLFWGSIVIFVSALALATVLLSEDVRWRAKRFIARHFYRSKYDYRQQWIGFTARLGSRVTLEELAPEILAAIAGAVGATRAVLYVADEPHRHYHLAGGLDVDRAPASLVGSDIHTLADAEAGPLILGNGGAPVPIPPDPGLAEVFAPGGVLVPLRWQGTVIGFMGFGPERTGEPYGPEDQEFLATAAEQAAGTLVTARLSETLAQAREFEAFHRLTSFVIHDLKNAIAALSLLSQNALAHFDDPEFQRDAIRTVSKTADRMKTLLAKLTSAAASGGRHAEPVDLSAVAREAAAPLKTHDEVRIRLELGTVSGVTGDADALLRVAQNLLTNAVEAVAARGDVVVRTYEDGPWAVLEVSDTGCGIPERFLRKDLFAPFRTTKKTGWGIGLYHAKGIVEAHKGVIEVASKPGAGTTFAVRLPREVQP